MNLFNLWSALRAEGFSITDAEIAQLAAAGIAPIAGGDGTITAPRSTGIDMDLTTNLEFANRVRYVDDVLQVMSDYDVFFTKRIGGDSFEADNIKVEWTEDDLWARRFLVAEALDASETAIDVPTGTAHRYPKGTLLKIDTEIMWVAAAADANTLTVTRGAMGTTAATHLISAETLIVGNSIAEGAARTLRGTPVYTMPFNYCQIFRQAVGVTFRQQDMNVYGRTQPDLTEKIGLTTQQLMVSLEEGLIEGARYPGTTATDPGGFGGLDFYLNATDSNVTDLNSAAVTEKDILDLLQTAFYKVGASNMGKLLLVDAWTKRKINSFWAPSVRQTRSENTIGVVVDFIETDFGRIEVFMHTAVPKGKAFLVNPDYVELGHYGTRGRWNTRALPTTDDTVEEEVYGDYTAKVKNVLAQGKIQEISLTA